MKETITREEFFQYLNKYEGSYSITSDDFASTVVQFSYVEEEEEGNDMSLLEEGNDN